MDSIVYSDGEFRVIGEKVLIKVDKPSSVTAGGIILPETVVSNEQKRATTGVISAVSGRLDPEKCGFQVNDRAIFGKYSGLDLEFDDNPYKLLGVDEVLCLYEEVESAEPTG